MRMIGLSMQDTTAKQILSGYVVLDCTIAMAGPFAAQRLGDLGADVIKIEPPEGEWQRRMAAGGEGSTKINASFLSLNRNKRSLAVNLKDPAGREIVHNLARTADVFLQNYRLGVAERLGVDFETLHKINPKLIYVSISGFGSEGPYVNNPGQDLLLQALSGAMRSVGRASDPPSPSGNFLVDAATAYGAFEGAIAALLHRERTGEGQLVEVNMLDTAVALQMQELSVFTISGRPQERTAEPHAHVYIRAPYGVFSTRDSYIALAFPPLSKLARIFNEPRLAAMNDEVDCFEKRDLIHQIVAEHLKSKTTHEWLELMRKDDVWAGPVYGFADLVDDPQVKINGSFIEYDHHTEGRLKTPGFPIRFHRTPASVTRGAPHVGEHTSEIMRSAGYTDEKIDALRNSGIVGGA
jgi:crotonobetainyl-CoA:carnitine CoA-transferase CaiB-like acyl-CoA transferase